MSESQALILGCAGRSLTREEVSFFRDEAPWGFILFSRNLSEPEQVRDLVDHLRDCVGRHAPVFIDQEGGRVQRLRPPLAPDYPAAAALGRLFRDSEEDGLRAAWLMARLIAFDLSRYRIDANCLPVLDVPVDGASEAIGERAYDREPKIVAALGRAAAEGLKAGGVLPVMKHIPGHGRATADSHLELPVVTASIGELMKHDFAPFQALNDLPAAMTAHIVYRAVDPANPATMSGKVVDEVIRGEIGFEGLLISDDVSMKALSGDFRAKTAAILAAGVDIVLHCNGVMDEMRAVVSAARPLEGRALVRAATALAWAGKQDDGKENELREEFAQYFEAVA
ncbi:MAG: beta-N-acetylhexosaminidase [Mesorhizobium sp.]|nr:beta-N-acetylhexosaminidase [Mesorhizobium sp.]MBN9242803.1 beta-N-acetylhexosaminidase [Mesorhizobium sp.]